MIEEALGILKKRLGSDSYHSEKTIIEKVDEVLKTGWYPTLDRDILIRAAKHFFYIHMDEHKILVGNERREPWLRARKASIEWHFWKRYKIYLEDEKNFAA